MEEEAEEEKVGEKEVVGEEGDCQSNQIRIPLVPDETEPIRLGMKERFPDQIVMNDRMQLEWTGMDLDELNPTHKIGMEGTLSLQEIDFLDLVP